MTTNYPPTSWICRLQILRRILNSTYVQCFYQIFDIYYGNPGGFCIKPSLNLICIGFWVVWIWFKSPSCNLQFLSRDIGQQYMYASITATVLLHTNKYTTNVLSSRNWGLELRIIRSSFTDYSECSIHSDMSFKLLYVAICTLLRTPDRSGAVVIVGGGALYVQEVLYILYCEYSTLKFGQEFIDTQCSVKGLTSILR